MQPIEITNKAFRKAMDKAGMQDIQLVKGDGYFYIVGKRTCSLSNTDIYLNSFKQQSISQWVEDIASLLNQ